MVRDSYEVVIAGAGPAGTSAAIHLAQAGARVLLVEQKKFPREKLCGEFISPECNAHFVRLGVEAEMRSAEPVQILQTRFYSRSGNHLSIPSSWFGSSALGLSRAVMDNNLLERAIAIGVDVVENSHITQLVQHQNVINGVRLQINGNELEISSTLTIDATGRSRALARKAQQSIDRLASKSKFIAFKAHLTETGVAANTCEIYSYRGGYGGLSSIEDGLSNLCFIVSAEAVRECGSNPDKVVRDVVMKNARAFETLNSSQVHSEWLSASWESFGRYQPAPVKGLLAIGDAASFIDPFTGSGMLMAFESAELASQVIVFRLNKSTAASTAEPLEVEYARRYKQKFGSRLRLCSVLRRTAFRPRLAEAVIAAFNLSSGLRNRLAKATRSDPGPNPYFVD